jgi:membrane protein implicated in regulation of membrane protease activity
MSATVTIAYAFIAVAFVAFFAMATIMYGQFALKAWRPFFMSLAVLLILLVIMKRATDIVNQEREQRPNDRQERIGTTPPPS